MVFNGSMRALGARGPGSSPGGPTKRAMVQPGGTPASGAGGREFESPSPDQTGCGPAWSGRVAGGHEDVGSNPTSPTNASEERTQEDEVAPVNRWLAQALLRAQNMQGCSSTEERPALDRKVVGSTPTTPTSGSPGSALCCVATPGLSATGSRTQLPGEAGSRLALDQEFEVRLLGELPGRRSGDQAGLQPPPAGLDTSAACQLL